MKKIHISKPISKIRYGHKSRCWSWECPAAADNLGLAADVALKFLDYDNRMEVEDTEEFGDALVGLSRAEKAFDPSRDTNFSTLAWWCCRNEVIRGWKRRTQNKVTAIQIEEEENVFVHHDEYVDREDIKTMVDKVLACFSEDKRGARQRKILEDYYLRSLYMHEIGDELGVSKERIRQIRVEAERHVRSVIGEEL